MPPMEPLALPIDESGITVHFYRYCSDPLMSGTAVVFKIPDSAQILSRDPEEFMDWCHRQMMHIAAQAKGMSR